MEKLYRWLLLKAIRGLGEVSIKKLWLNFRSASEILSASHQELKELLGEERAEALARRSLTFEPEKVIKLVEKENIGWTTLEDDDYPAIVREIEDPPPVLFYRGTINPIAFVGVVGTRKPDAQSLRFIGSLVHELVRKGYGVASGGAFGCDYHSHKECLLAGGFTVCLLGMGLLRMPQYLERLSGNNMLFLSEFLPDSTADGYTFPRRNRLISGLSRAVVVAEAGEKSGALITAEYAVKQKKPLWVYIGNALSQRWLGCIKLVNEGKAKILYHTEVLFDSLPSPHRQADPILELLSTPKTFDDLLDATGMESPELTLKLLQLEMEGKILKNGSYYISL